MKKRKGENNQEEEKNILHKIRVNDKNIFRVYFPDRRPKFYLIQNQIQN